MDAQSGEVYFCTRREETGPREGVRGGGGVEYTSRTTSLSPRKVQRSCATTTLKYIEEGMLHVANLQASAADQSTEGHSLDVTERAHVLAGVTLGGS